MQSEKKLESQQVRIESFKLKNQLVQKLQRNNSFGYKFVQFKQLDIINKFYSSLYQQQLNLNLQNMQFFGSWQTMYVYLVLGLTKTQDLIVLSSSIPREIQICIKNLNRRTARIKSNQIPNKQINQGEKNVLLIISNPDMISGLCLQKNFIKNLLQMCSQKRISVICDETLSLLSPNQGFYSLIRQSYEKLIIIKQIGATFNEPNITKYLCFFKNVKFKQLINKSSAKSLKILPNDLIIMLIQIQMSQNGLKCRKNLINSIKINYQLFNKLLIFLKHELFVRNECQSQYFIINQNKIQPQARKYIFEYLPAKRLNEKEYQEFIRIDLNIGTSQFKQRVNKIISMIPKQKL